MSKLFQRPLLKWQEPRVVRRHIDEYEAKKRHPAIYFIGLASIFALVMFSWWLNTLKPDSKAVTFPVACLLSLGLAVFCVYLTPLINHFAQPKILILENSIRWIRGNSWKDLKYENLEGYAVNSIIINEKDFPVIVLITKKGKTSILGIDQSVSLEQLNKILTVKIGQKDSQSVQSAMEKFLT